eukprot:scaffold210929_cov50-Attheya_sp.AAC.1
MVAGRHVSLFLTVLAVTHHSVKAFVSTRPSFLSSCNNGPSSQQTIVRMAEEAWDGHVASNTEDGSIRGCKLTLEPGTLTDWTITIDGAEADLGKFSLVVYNKLIKDARTQRFQGFRPGTIPAHIEPTYRAFSMDEVAREAVLEAMSQNNIKPFDDSRKDIFISRLAIPAPKLKKKKKGGKKKKGATPEDAAAAAAAAAEPEPEQPKWVSFETMKEAIDFGWKPGQSFSFVATNVKGQQLKDAGSLEGATRLGDPSAAANFNRVDLDALDV